MESVVKSFLGLYFMAFLCVTGIGFLHTQLQMSLAEEFLLESVLRMEEGCYDGAVISMCEEEALNKGYILDVEVEHYGNNEYRGVCVLTYEFQIPLISADFERKITERIR